MAGDKFKIEDQPGGSAPAEAKNSGKEDGLSANRTAEAHKTLEEKFREINQRGSLRKTAWEDLKKIFKISEPRQEDASAESAAEPGPTQESEGVQAPENKKEEDAFSGRPWRGDARKVLAGKNETAAPTPPSSVKNTREYIANDLAGQQEAAGSKKETAPENKLEEDLVEKRKDMMGAQSSWTGQLRKMTEYEKRKADDDIRRTILAIGGPGGIHADPDKWENEFIKEFSRVNGLSDSKKVNEAGEPEIISSERAKAAALYIRSQEKYRSAAAMRMQAELVSVRNEMKRAGLPPEDIENALSYLGAKAVIEEKEKYQLLSADNLPQKDRSILRKGLERWGKLPRSRRVLYGVLVSSAIGLGAGAIGGGLAAGTAATIVGRRVVGGTASAVLMPLVSKGLDWTLSSKWVNKKLRLQLLREEVWDEQVRGLEGRELSVEDAESVKSFMQGVSSGYGSLCEKRYGANKKKAMIKMAGMLIGGVSIGHMSAGFFSAASGGHAGDAMHHASAPSAHADVHSDSASGPGMEIARSHSIAGSSGPRAGLSKLISELDHKNAEETAYQKLATVQKGEGFWQPVHRQMEFQLRHHPDKFNFKPEDLDNNAKVKAFVDAKTTRFLASHGMIGPNGYELRIQYEPNARVSVGEDGSLDFRNVAYEKNPTFASDAELPSGHAAGPEIELPGPGHEKMIPLDVDELVKDMPPSTVSDVPLATGPDDISAPGHAITEHAQEFILISDSGHSIEIPLFTEKLHDLNEVGKKLLQKDILGFAERDGIPDQERIFGDRHLLEQLISRHSQELSGSVRRISLLGGDIPHREIGSLENIGMPRLENVLKEAGDGSYAADTWMNYRGMVRDMKIGEFLDLLPRTRAGTIDPAALDRTISLPGKPAEIVLRKGLLSLGEWLEERKADKFMTIEKYFAVHGAI